MQNIFKGSALAVAALAIIAGTLYMSAQRDAELDALADCVHATAKAQGYAGNVYGSEAWQVFAPVCNR